MTKTILFLCPHHAAKSVIASAYAERLADEQQLELNILSAGTEPDATIMPVVADLLEADGFKVTGHQPRLVTSQELVMADIVITMGCDLVALGVPEQKRRDWSDVPPASADVKICRDAIIQHLQALMRELKNTN
jgi:arsenate reductase (thioredoxin)